jgi:hypothetical protein
MPSDRRFPPPWTIEEMNDAFFIVRDKNGQALAYVYFESDPAGARPLICSHATKRGGLRRISQSCRGCWDGHRDGKSAGLL